MSQRLSDVIEQYVASMPGNGLAKNTVKTTHYALDQLLAHTGNIQIKSLTDRHFDEWFAKEQSRGLSPGTLNVQRTAFRGLIAYAQRRRFISDRTNPVGHIKRFAGVPRERLRIPQQDFARLLDCAYHPRDRIILALGMYLFLRASEIAHLKVGDLDLVDGELQVAVIKTKQRDVMPISNELDTELRRWLRYYQEDQQAIPDPTWYLVPAHGAPRPVWSPEAKRWTGCYDERNLAPGKPITNAARHVTRVLERAGYATREEPTSPGKKGKATGEGVHTLRRSGARALFDKLVDDGYDGAIRTVQAMLHHSNSAMTEHYIGMDLDRQSRNRLLKGRDMFAVTAENVVPLHTVKEN